MMNNVSFVVLTGYSKKLARSPKPLSRHDVTKIKAALAVHSSHINPLNHLSFTSQQQQQISSHP
jgi:hypothetical protein